MQQRYWLIELLAYWEGKLNTTHLIDTYSITRQSASKIINRYISDYPNNLEYDQSLKAYTPSASFLPAFITRDANEYLAYLTQKNEAVIDHGLSSLAEHSEVLQLPKRRVEPKILRNLVLAAKTQSRVEVEYLSLSNPEHETRVIAPHTFVYTGLRWHLRAYCEKALGLEISYSADLLGIQTLLVRAR